MGDILGQGGCQVTRNREPDKTHHQSGASGACQPLEKALVNETDIGIETSQTDTGAGTEDKGRGPTQSTEILEREFKGNQSRANTESGHVRDGDKLFNEATLCVRLSSDTSVHTI